MASFGEALVGAFNTTYSSVSQGALRATQQRAIQDELDRNARFSADVTRSQRDRGITNPDGTFRRPGVTASGAGLEAAGGGAGALPAGTPAASTPAPITDAQATPAPTASPTAMAAQTGVGAGGIAGADPAARPASTALAAADRAGAEQTPRGQAPVVAGGAGRSGLAAAAQESPNIERQVQEIGRLVGDSPTSAMVVGGAMLPRVPGEPTPQQAVAMAPRLIQEVHAASGRAAGEPLRRADWDAYLQDTLLSAQRNLPPERQVQVLASVDRIRTAGLQRFVGLAVAAAQANDMEGVARAMNGASSYVPDGYQDQFRAVQGGLQISRTPEEGQRGQQQTMIANPQQVAMYAMRMMDPAWSMTHELGIRRQDEVERHNRADEGLRGAAIAETRASRGERTAERNAEAGAVRAGLAVTRAEDAVEEARRGGSQEEITAAQTRLREARAARDEAEARGGVRGLQVSAAIEDRRDRERIRRQEAEDRATGRTAFTPAEREAVTAATETMSGDRAPPGSTFARSWLSDTFSRNRNVDPNVLGDALRRMGTGDGTVGLDPRTGRIVDRTSGRSYQASPDLQELIRSRSGASGGSGGGSNSPTRPAPLDEGRAPSGRRSSLSAAEEGGSGAGEGVATSVTIPRDIERRAVTRMTDVNQDMTAGEARSRFRAEVSSRVRTLRREAGIPDRPTAVGRTQWNAANDRIVRQAAEEAMRQLGGR